MVTTATRAKVKTMQGKATPAHLKIIRAHYKFWGEPIGALVEYCNILKPDGMVFAVKHGVVRCVREPGDNRPYKLDWAQFIHDVYERTYQITMYGYEQNVKVGNIKRWVNLGPVELSEAELAQVVTDAQVAFTKWRLGQ